MEVTSTNVSWSLRKNPKSKPPKEDFVAAFILQALPEIVDAWRPLFREEKMGLTLTGVFCHNTPKTTFYMSGTMKHPELADLLIVRRHEDKAGVVKQVAVLIQAKMSDTGEIKLPNGDPQLYLYTLASI